MGDLLDSRWKDLPSQRSCSEVFAQGRRVTIQPGAGRTVVETPVRIRRCTSRNSRCFPTITCETSLFLFRCRVAAAFRAAVVRGFITNLPNQEGDVRGLFIGTDEDWR
jgi:hypothetical protein